MSQDLANLAVTLGVVIGGLAVLIVLSICWSMFLEWIDESDRRRAIWEWFWITCGILVVLGFIAFVVWGFSAGGTLT